MTLETDKEEREGGCQEEGCYSSLGGKGDL